jgi:hypothetical protein
LHTIPAELIENEVGHGFGVAVSGSQPRSSLGQSVLNSRVLKNRSACGLPEPSRPLIPVQNAHC